MKISYAILTHNEGGYIETLLHLLTTHKREEDEIVVVDDFSDDPLTLEILEKYKPQIKFEQRVFDGDASSKNYLNSLCVNDFIVQLDADETFPIEFINFLPQLLYDNQEIELFRVPRINTVEGIGLSQVNQWGWQISPHPRMVDYGRFNLSIPEKKDQYDLLKKYDLIINEETPFKDMVANITYKTPIANYPDYQDRIYKNIPTVKWEGLLHSKIKGYKTFSSLPMQEAFSILHHKHLKRQIDQNNLYTKIEQNGKQKYKV